RMSTTRELIEAVESELVRTEPADLTLTIEPRLLGPIQDTKFLVDRLVHVFRQRTRNLERTRNATEEEVEGVRVRVQRLIRDL
ncbi:MAG: hypothetical protein LN412_08000, partial [Candidatus Thermoplasmatota archaeon]|nr:hypothetical protein [Candidatus Thermoplasmatota archaeon]